MGKLRPQEGQAGGAGAGTWGHCQEGAEASSQGLASPFLSLKGSDGTPWGACVYFNKNKRSGAEL